MIPCGCLKPSVASRTLVSSAQLRVLGTRPSRRATHFEALGVSCRVLRPAPSPNIGIRWNGQIQSAQGTGSFEARWEGSCHDRKAQLHQDMVLCTERRCCMDVNRVVTRRRDRFDRISIAGLVHHM